MKKKLVLVEFNELTPSLMDRFIDEGHLPNFKKFRNKAQVYTTDAKNSGELLNPWIQWLSVHTGLTASEHGVTRLNDSAKFDGEFIWDKLSHSGLKSWVCGSMNTGYSKKFNGLLIPDPWSLAVPPYPQGRFDKYLDFVTQSVQEHTSKEYVSPVDFLKFMFKNGLSFKTLTKLVTQLINEKLDKTIRWKRASVLDWIQFDLFKHIYDKEKPDFSTFFLNSTAHYQHHYWKDMDPKAFGKKIAENNDSRAKAILTGFKNLDAVLGDIVNMVDDNTCIIFCTGLSQKPYLTEGTDGERHYYHLIKKDHLNSTLGLKEEFKYSPVMAEQFFLECPSEEEALVLSKKLQQFKMPDTSFFHSGSNDVFGVKVEGKKVFAQCRCSKSVPLGTDIKNIENQSVIPFYDVFYHMDDVKTGIHDPHGLLWIYDKEKESNIYDDNVELEFIPQYIMDYFHKV